MVIFPLIQNDNYFNEENKVNSGKEKAIENKMYITEQSVEVIELVPAGVGGVTRELENYYWGLGFSSNQHIEYIDHIKYLVLEVEIVYAGYCGASSGLISGDKIYLLNDERLTEANDIRGNGPSDIKLTLVRDTAKINIHATRCKVYY